ncbi:sulfatase-like hydrolase/transferase [Streptomyces sp. NPDC048567]|uniref:sulfatase-like hydrolase/transferase n=1 Tax=Streptomyces sp. NPDC048567 TaxID=3365570 RepID=UPI00371D25BF
MSEPSTAPEGGVPAPPSGARPQVIVVLTDQQRWDTAGVHGNRAGVTPEFDRIAREGTLFEQAVTPNPVCAPARSSLQTGRYPTATGVFRNGLPLPADIPTLAGEFAAAGYATGYIGKWHLAGDANPDGPVPAARRGGYGRWLASDRLEFTSDAYRTVVHDEDGAPVRLPGYRSDALIDAAIRFVAEHHDRPYLLFLSLLEPHHQNPTDDYPAPAGYRERYEGAWLPPDLAALSPGAEQGGAHRHLAGYLGQIKRVDEGVGRLRDALRSLGTEENTVLAWTADHGSHFRTRNSEYKRSAHEASVRVPLAATGPGFSGGGLVRRPVSTVDLMPMQGLTANHFTTETYAVKPGDTAVVHAAAGGVGLMLTQMIKARGGRVIGLVSRPEKAAIAEEAGADHVLVSSGAGFEDRVRELTDGEGAHVVYDGGGTSTFRSSQLALRLHGVHAYYGPFMGVPSLSVTDLPSSILLSYPTVQDHVPTREALVARTGEVFAMVRAGQVSPRIGGRYALSDAARAHSDLESRRTTGKLLLIP